MVSFMCFFFSSRSRHTRCSRDWSSDVCSSDLPFISVPAYTLVPLPEPLGFAAGAAISCGTGTAYGALKRLDLSGRDTPALFRPGPGGLRATMLRRALGARGIAIDVAPQRPGLAPE